METEISFDKAALLWTARVGGEVIAEADASGHSGTLYLNKLWVKSDFQGRGSPRGYCSGSYPTRGRQAITKSSC